METPSKTLKSASIHDIEETIAQALSIYTDFPARVEMRLFQVVEESASDVLSVHNYRIELKVKVPRMDLSNSLFDLK